MPDAGSLSEILRDGLSLYSARLIEVSTRIIYILVLARLLGAADYGLWGYAQSLYVSLLTLGGLGAGVLLARAAGCGPEALPRMVGQTLAVRIIALAIIAAAYVAIIWLTFDAPNQWFLLSLLLIALAARDICVWAEWVLVAAGRSRSLPRLYALTRPVEPLLGSALLLTGFGLPTVFYLHCGTWLWAALLCWTAVKGAGFAPHPDWDTAALRSNLREGLPLGLLSGATTFLMFGPLTLAPYLLQDAGTTGQLALLVQVLVVVSGIAWSMASSALPVLSRENGHGIATHRFALFTMGLGWLLAAGALMAALTIVPWLIDTLLGAEYQTAARLMPVAALVIAPLTWAVGLGQILLAQRRQGAALAAVLAGAAALVVTAVLLMPRGDGLGGAFGGIVAVLSGNLAWALIILIVLLRGGVLRVRHDDEPGYGPDIPRRDE